MDKYVVVTTKEPKFAPNEKGEGIKVDKDGNPLIFNEALDAAQHLKKGDTLTSLKQYIKR